MKVVLDTNVLVSGLLSRAGTCATIMDFVTEGRLIAVFDARMVDEYERVCAEPRLSLGTDSVHAVLLYLKDTAERVTPTPLDAELPDPDDLPFLEVATEAGAILVTGNLKHFPAAHAVTVKVLSPRELLDSLRL